jgi:hypothetical protein
MVILTEVVLLLKGFAILLDLGEKSSKSLYLQEENQNLHLREAN